eukprot:scaffold21632_cov62-Phaeocystis_antarctica.AAC.7
MGERTGSSSTTARASGTQTEMLSTAGKVSGRGASIPGVTVHVGGWAGGWLGGEEGGGVSQLGRAGGEDGGSSGGNAGGGGCGGDRGGSSGGDGGRNGQALLACEYSG